MDAEYVVNRLILNLMTDSYNSKYSGDDFLPISLFPNFLKAITRITLEKIIPLKSIT